MDYDHSTCTYYDHSTCMYYDHSKCIHYDHSTCMYYDDSTCMYYDHSTWDGTLRLPRMHHLAWLYAEGYSRSTQARGREILHFPSISQRDSWHGAVRQGFAHTRSAAGNAFQRRKGRGHPPTPVLQGRGVGLQHTAATGASTDLSGHCTTRDRRKHALKLQGPPNGRAWGHVWH